MLYNILKEREWGSQVSTVQVMYCTVLILYRYLLNGTAVHLILIPMIPQHVFVAVLWLVKVCRVPWQPKITGAGAFSPATTLPQVHARVPVWELSEQVWRLVRVIILLGGYIKNRKLPALNQGSTGSADRNVWKEE